MSKHDKSSISAQELMGLDRSEMITGRYRNGDKIPDVRREENPLLEQVWVPQKGPSIKIKDMSESHAKNALAFVLDKIAKGHPVWTNRHTGQFKYDDTKVIEKPFDSTDLAIALDEIAIILGLTSQLSNKE